MALRPTSDLGSLMQNALEEYNETTKDLKRDTDPGMEARSIADVDAYVASHVDRFQKFRHPGTKVDVLRTAIGNNLGQIQGMSNVLAGPTTTAFPAAAPIFTAINLLIFTGNRVKADFDQLMDFLEEVGACMNSISIVEGFVHTGRRIPQLDEDFKKVFSAVLTLCGISTRYLKDGRLYRGLLRGLLGDDRGLSVAYQKLQKSMVSLGRSIANGTFAGIVVMTAGMTDLQDKVTALESLAKETNQTAKETNQTAKETKDIVKEIRDDLKDQHIPNPRRIRIFFEGFGPWQAAFDERKKKFVDGTAEWMLKYDECYKTWCGEGDRSSWGRGRASVLWVSGGTGTGKSMLAYKIVESLNSYAGEFRGLAAAYFFFLPEKKSSLRAALYSLIIQLADYDELYCRRVTSIIKNMNQTKSENIDISAIWKKFIADQYVFGSSRAKLYIVLDGIEELSSEDQQSLQAIADQIISEKLNIKLLLIGQSQLNEKFGVVGGIRVPHIEVTTARIEGAVKCFIDDRVGKFQISLEDSLKEEIIETLSGNNGGFAFVSASLEEIEATEQVEDIPDVLKALPVTFKDLLKRVMDRTLRNLQATRPKEERLKALKILLYWSASSKRYLTVKELSSVLAMKTKYSNFNIVTEVTKSCVGLLLLENAAAGEQQNNINEERNAEDHDPEFSQNFVQFREFRFESCFNDLEWTTEVNNILIENSHVAQLELAITTMQVLSFAPSDPQYGRTRDVENYCAIYWDDHLVELDIDKSTDEQLSRVIKAMKGVFTTPETTSLALERQNHMMYDAWVNEEMPKDEISNDRQKVVRKWCMRAQAIGAEKLHLSAVEFGWVESIIASSSNLMIPLAQEHVRHWLKTFDITIANEQFRYAFKAFASVSK